MKFGKAVWPGGIPIEILGDNGIKWLTNLFNNILKNWEMPDEWRISIVPTYKNKGDNQSCTNYGRIIKINTMKL